MESLNKKLILASIVLVVVGSVSLCKMLYSKSEVEYSSSTVYGMINQIDGDTIVVSNDENQSVRFKVNDCTTFLLNDSPIDFSSLQSNSFALFTTTDGILTVVNVIETNKQ